MEETIARDDKIKITGRPEGRGSSPAIHATGTRMGVCARNGREIFHVTLSGRNMLLNTNICECIAFDAHKLLRVQVASGPR